MNHVEFIVGGSTMRAHDSAIVTADEEPIAAMIEQVIQSISTDIEVTCGGVTMHLAAWQDPDHWSEDWAEKGIDADDVPGLVAGQVAVYGREKAPDA